MSFLYWQYHPNIIGTKTLNLPTEMVVKQSSHDTSKQQDLDKNAPLNLWTPQTTSYDVKTHAPKVAAPKVQPTHDIAKESKVQLIREASTLHGMRNVDNAKKNFPNLVKLIELKSPLVADCGFAPSQKWTLDQSTLAQTGIYQLQNKGSAESEGTDNSCFDKGRAIIIVRPTQAQQSLKGKDDTTLRQSEAKPSHGQLRNGSGNDGRGEISISISVKNKAEQATATGMDGSIEQSIGRNQAECTEKLDSKSDPVMKDTGERQKDKQSDGCKDKVNFSLKAIEPDIFERLAANLKKSEKSNDLLKNSVILSSTQVSELYKKQKIEADETRKGVANEGRSQPEGMGNEKSLSLNTNMQLKKREPNSANGGIIRNDSVTGIKREVEGQNHASSMVNNSGAKKEFGEDCKNKMLSPNAKAMNASNLASQLTARVEGDNNDCVMETFVESNSRTESGEFSAKQESLEESQQERQCLFAKDDFRRRIDPAQKGVARTESGVNGIENGETRNQRPSLRERKIDGEKMDSSKVCDEEKSLGEVKKCSSAEEDTSVKQNVRVCKDINIEGGDSLRQKRHKTRKCSFHDHERCTKLRRVARQRSIFADKK